MVLFRRVRYAVPVGLVALLLALVLMGTASTPTDGSSQVELAEVREDVVRELYDSSGRMVNPDRKMQSIAKANDGGFGGYYFDENNPSTVYVYMLDVTKAAEAEAAFRAAQNKDAQYTRVVPVQGNHSMDDLVDWFYQTLKAFDDGGIQVNGAGLRVRDNGFAFMLGGDLDGAWAIIDELGIPRDAASLTIGEWELLADKDNVQARWRPVVGGIEIEGVYTYQRCTLGFVTIRDGVRGKPIIERSWPLFV